MTETYHGGFAIRMTRTSQIAKMRLTTNRLLVGKVIPRVERWSSIKATVSRKGASRRRRGVRPGRERGGRERRGRREQQRMGRRRRGSINCSLRV